MRSVHAQGPTLRRLLLPLLSALACNGGQPSERRAVGAETIVIDLVGPLERAAVEFPHDRHTRALQGSCEACHPRDARGALSTKLGRVDDRDGRASLMKLYHDRCIGCHTERAQRNASSGPRTCGECHVQREVPRIGRRGMAFSYALHGAHVRAAGERCQACHHVKNPQTGRLEYRKGAEDSCSACHPREARGEQRSLRQASHTACIGCHLLPLSEGTARRGPVTCAGCHGERRAEPRAPRLSSRLMRGQPDRIVIRGSSKVGSVPFDHRGHEAQALFCTTCHHASLQRCSSCHTEAPTAKGGGVSLAAAYHSVAATQSCVGCHAQAARAKGCAGCHQTLSAPPTSRSCGRCHQARAAASRPTTSASRPAVEALPPASPELPEQVTIASLAGEYAPSVLPHRRIVAHLDGVARRSHLAWHFHGGTEALCAACHHHSPVGTRPPACRSCHGGAADPTSDRPGLKAAYHRQCLGCHQQMGIRAMGCSDCHARRREERR